MASGYAARAFGQAHGLEAYGFLAYGLLRGTYGLWTQDGCGSAPMVHRRLGSKTKKFCLHCGQCPYLARVSPKGSPASRQLKQYTCTLANT
eukprot:135668-Pelagomonas_calceolata.AAC.7